jgi:aldehyde reductase
MLEGIQFNPRVKIQPYAVQVELSIYNQQLAMIQYCESRAIAVIAWSPFGSAKVGPFGVTLLEDPVLVKIASEVGKTPGQVAL